MTAWSDLFATHLDTLLTGMDKDAILERYGWIAEFAEKASEALSPASLAERPPEQIYALLDSIRLPKCQVRMANLGRMNQAQDVVDGIAALLKQPGDFAVKYRAGKIPQAGVVALSQILTLARPDRFAIRNAPFTKALAKQIPFYTAKALDELGYEEYLDICRELARIAVAAMKQRGLGEWAERYRFLLLYALLVG